MGNRPEIPRLSAPQHRSAIPNRTAVQLLPACRRQVSAPDRREDKDKHKGIHPQVCCKFTPSSSSSRSTRALSKATIYASPHASYMYGRRPHSLLSCRPDSCTSHPCLGPAVGTRLGRDVSRAPAASPGACAQYVRLWQYGHARHERDRGKLLLLLLPIPPRARPSPAQTRLGSAAAPLVTSQLLLLQ